MSRAPDEDVIDQIVDQVFEEADELEHRGLHAESLGRLRAALNRIGDINPDGLPEMKEAAPGLLTWSVNANFLALRARESVAAIASGQAASSPHDFLGLYEMANPRLPEQTPRLRLWMTRLRISAAAHHEDFLKALAWSHDLYEQGRTWASTPIEFEGLLGIALYSDRVGLPQSGRNVFRRLFDDERWLSDTTAEYRWHTRMSYAGALFSDGRREDALAEYESLAEEIGSSNDLSTDGMQVQVRVLRRRADCYRRLGRVADAERDLVLGFRVVDQVRLRLRYQGARSADYELLNELRHLRALIFDMPSLTGEAALETALIAGNSAVSAAVRSFANANSGGSPRTIYLRGDEREARISASLVDRWSVVDRDSMERCQSDSILTLFVDVDLHHSFPMRGWTLAVGMGDPPRISRWELTEDEDALFRSLLRPPNRESAASDAWTLTQDDRRLHAIGSKVLAALAGWERGTAPEGVRIVPLQALWRFPFLALGIQGRPIGARLPVVVSTAAPANCAPHGLRHWAGHFDLSIPLAVSDLQAFLAIARTAGCSTRLFDAASDLGAEGGASVIAFAGHGDGVGASQHLRLASGERVHAGEFDSLAQGCTIVLDACWTGSVLDIPGSEQVDLPLILLARGAHSVVGTLGPVLDVHASRLFGPVLEGLGHGMTAAESLHLVISDLLESSPSLPLAAWASYLTVGRHVHFTE